MSLLPLIASLFHPFDKTQDAPNILQSFGRLGCFYSNHISALIIPDSKEIQHCAVLPPCADENWVQDENEEDLIWHLTATKQPPTSHILATYQQQPPSSHLLDAHQAGLRHPPGGNQLNPKRFGAFTVEDGARAPVEMILMKDSTLTGEEKQLKNKSREKKTCVGLLMS